MSLPSVKQTFNEKKVEYIELIYDLVFVYLLGRSSSLLDRVEAGFISFSTIAGYLANSLIFLQIWYNTMLYINRYGKNRLRENIMLIVNMFLLYIMGATTGHGWDINYPAFALSWALILVNIALNYLLDLKEADASSKTHILQNTILLLGHAVMLGLSVPLYQATGFVAAPWTMIFGYLIIPFVKPIPVNFAHLSERVMLYVVFTFGEMVIINAEYFTAQFSLESAYFALMSFLVVAGLFYSYGFVYDRLIDRSKEKPGNAYMALHVVLILSLTFVTTSLEFLRESKIRDMPKTIMMLVSLFVYFFCLAQTERWSIRRYRKKGKFVLIFITCFIACALASFLVMGNGYACFAIIVLYIFLQLALLFLYDRYTSRRIAPSSDKSSE